MFDQIDRLFNRVKDICHRITFSFFIEKSHFLAYVFIKVEKALAFRTHPGVKCVVQKAKIVECRILFEQKIFSQKFSRFELLCERQLIMTAIFKSDSEK